MRSRNHREFAFTLVELLAVLAIVGIITAVIVAFSADSYRKTQLRDGAVQLVADLNRARAQAQRNSTDSVVTLSGTVGSPDASYTTAWAGGAAVTRSLPAPVRVAPVSSDFREATYRAPYGEVNLLGVIWEVSSASTSAKLYVKAVGVTGKVMLSATQD